LHPFFYAQRSNRATPTDVSTNKQLFPPLPNDRIAAIEKRVKNNDRPPANSEIHEK
jgi:hypothetical protein